MKRSRGAADAVVSRSGVLVRGGKQGCLPASGAAVSGTPRTPARESSCEYLHLLRAQSCVLKCTSQTSLSKTFPPGPGSIASQASRSGDLSALHDRSQERTSEAVDEHPGPDLRRSSSALRSSLRFAANSNRLCQFPFTIFTQHRHRKCKARLSLSTATSRRK